MEPKFSVGTKVRIKPPDFPGRIFSPGLKYYENMTGEIVDSTNVVAFVGESTVKIDSIGKRISLYHYSVRISDEITLFGISEDYLEEGNQNEQ
jgi:hypothetical protein